MCQDHTNFLVDRIRSIMMVVLVLYSGGVCLRGPRNIKDHKPVQFSGSATVSGWAYFLFR